MSLDYGYEDGPPISENFETLLSFQECSSVLGGVESTLIAGLLSDTFLKPSVAF
jgi:hypothetical protein